VSATEHGKRKMDEKKSGRGRNDRGELARSFEGGIVGKKIRKEVLPPLISKTDSRENTRFEAGHERA